MRQVFAAGLIVVAGALPALGQGYRYIDDFDYSSPEAVAEQFTDHLGRADFLSAYYLLSPQAKDAFHTAIASGRMGTMFPGLEQFEYPGLVGTRDAPRILTEDLAEDLARLFDDMLAGATQDGQMPFSFAGGAVEVTMETPEGAEAAIDGATDGLRLGLTQTEWGEWRVDGIAWGDGTLQTGWSVSPEAEALPPDELPAQRTFLDEFDFSTPEAVAEDFVTAMREGDWYRAYWAFSPQAKEMILAEGRPIDMLFPRLDTSDLPGTGLFRPNVTRADALALDTMRDRGVLFDRLMLAAERQGVLPFDFTEASLAEVGESTPVQAMDSNVIAEAAATVAAAGEPAELSLRMVQLPNEEWRIDRILWDGSLEKGQPWGVPL